jgi:hypothetical protein
MESEITKLTFCQSCGRGGMEENANFCPNCGVSMEHLFVLFACSSCQSKVYVSGKAIIHCMTCGSALSRGGGLEA